MSDDVQQILQSRLAHIAETDLTAALGYLSAEWIAGLTDAQLESTSLKNRFQCLAGIQTLILDQVPTDNNDNPAPIDETAFVDEIKLIMRISESLRHTESYMGFWNLVRISTVARLMQNERYLQSLDQWVQPEKIANQSLLEVDPSLCREIAKNLDGVDIIDQEISEALNDTAQNQNIGIEFRKSRTHFFYQPKTKYRDALRNKDSFTTLYGCFSDDIFNPLAYGVMGVNVHPDADFGNPFEVGDTVFHEKVHGGGSQIARAVLSGAINKAHPFYHDGLLEIEMRRHQAYISSRILTANSAQFHERLAYFQGNEFGENLCNESAGRLTL